MDEAIGVAGGRHDTLAATVRVFVLPPALALLLVGFAIVALVNHQTREQQKTTYVTRDPHAAGRPAAGSP